jgi:hypothetical protein
MRACKLGPQLDVVSDLRGPLQLSRGEGWQGDWGLTSSRGILLTSLLLGAAQEQTPQRTAMTCHGASGA